MPHAIILSCIDSLQGENTTGTGTLETLKGLMTTVEQVEYETQPPISATQDQQAVLDWAAIIASMCENGFTCTSITEATSELETRIGSL